MARSRSHARGPLMLIARTSKIWSGVSWAKNVGAGTCPELPGFPSRSSAAPVRKKLRQVAHSAP